MKAVLAFDGEAAAQACASTCWCQGERFSDLLASCNRENARRS